MHDETDRCAYIPTPDQIQAACKLIQAVHRANEKAGRGNHVKRREANIKVTSSGSHRIERPAQ